MTSTSVVSAEHAVEWPIAGIVWQAEVSAAHYTSSDHTLRLDARLLRTQPRTQERWQLCFSWCATFKLQPVGVPGNERLTTPVQSPGYAPPPSVLYEIKHSDWLPTCQPIGGVPGDLHHYVLFESDPSLAWHIAATHCIGRRLEDGLDLGAADHALLPEALISASERG